MQICSAQEFRVQRDTLAKLGLHVVMPEFRNASDNTGADPPDEGSYPFPAGLNDCASGLQWLFDNKAKLAVSKIVLSGESGGGNLCLASALKAKRDGKLNQVDGVYAFCPYMSNLYAELPDELISLRECDGYLGATNATTQMVRPYDPDFANKTNPLTWPYHAQKDDLEGLPPHVVSVGELDPLRDEAVLYCKKLEAAGVTAESKVWPGLPHAWELIGEEVLGDLVPSSFGALKEFAYSLK